MRRVGLITIHDTQNWGSMAQTLGTYKGLEKIGVNVELIDYKCDAIYKREYQPFSNECKNIKTLLIWLLRYKGKKAKLDNYQRLLRTECKLSKQFDKESIGESNKLYDTFLVGSDIVWGFKTTGHDLSYLLDFTNGNKERLAFSASIGDKWSQSDIEEVKILLSRFSSISVREKQASEWIKSILNREIPVTCDPTNLFNGDFWRKYEDALNIPLDKYVLTYMGPGDLQNIKDALKYAEEKNLAVYDLSDSKRYIKGVKKISPQSFGQWISLILHSEMTFTGSYHGMMFSLYFHRPFFYYLRGHSNTRLESIAKECNFEHRLGTQENIKTNVNIDFGFVDKVLKVKRKASFGYLEEIFR